MLQRSSSLSRFAAMPPEGVAVLDLLGRRVHGTGGVVLDSVREFCRKRGIKFEPGPVELPGRPRLTDSESP